MTVSTELSGSLSQTERHVIGQKSWNNSITKRHILSYTAEASKHVIHKDVINLG